MELTDDEFELLYEAVCDRLSDYVHHYPGEFVHNGGNLDTYNALYGKVADEAKRRKFWWAR